MSFLFLISFFTIGSICRGSLWETGSETFHDWNFYNRFQKVPPAAETAEKFARVFLGYDPEIKTNTTTNETTRLKRRPGAFYNVVFLLDSSGSIGERPFRTGLLALQHLVMKSNPDSLFAAVTFSDSANVSFKFVKANQAIKELRKLRCQKGRTNTQHALELARTSLLLNHRSGVERTGLRRVLIITDGQSNIRQSMTLYQALRLKRFGVEIFVVAIGQYIWGIEELVSLATTPYMHLFRVSSTRGLLAVTKLLPVLPGSVAAKYRMFYPEGG